MFPWGSQGHDSWGAEAGLWSPDVWGSRVAVCPPPPPPRAYTRGCQEPFHRVLEHAQSSQLAHGGGASSSAGAGARAPGAGRHPRPRTQWAGGPGVHLPLPLGSPRAPRGPCCREGVPGAWGPGLSRWLSAVRCASSREKSPLRSQQAEERRGGDELGCGGGGPHAQLPGAGRKAGSGFGGETEAGGRDRHGSPSRSVWRLGLKPGTHRGTSPTLLPVQSV